MINLFRTEKGRRYFTVEHSDTLYDWECGYIEINEDWPRDYTDEFYDKFNFFQDATFLGLAFEYKGKMAVKGVSYEWKDGMPIFPENNFENIKKSVKPELQEWFQKIYEQGGMFWVVGFDDNHARKMIEYGRGVLSDAKRIAEEMDEVTDDDELIMTGREIIESLLKEWNSGQGIGSFESYACEVLWVARDRKYKVNAELTWAEEVEE